MNKGFIQFIIIIVLALVVISLLGVSLGELFQNKLLKDNFSILFRALQYLWDNYLSYPFQLFWQFFRNLIWEPFLDVLEGLKRGVSPFKDLVPQSELEPSTASPE